MADTRARTAGIAAGLLCFIALAVGPAPASAQQDRELLYSVGYSFRNRVNDRTRAFGSTIYEQRYAEGDLFGSQNEFDLLAGLTRDLREWARLEAGTGYYFIHRQEAPESHELRLWQSGTIDWPESPGSVRRFALHHRLRLEQRFRSSESEWRFAMRLRYRLAYALPINRYTLEPGALFIPTKVEFFLPVGGEFEEYFTQQIRLSVGLGYVFNPVWKGELRYAWRRSRDTLDQDLTLGNHYLELRFSTSIRIRDLLKAR